MGWHGRLALAYDLERGSTRARSRHHGPLRVLSSLYPEGAAVCHHVLVHPPGGLVGGDVLELDLGLAPGSHAVITTPGATRFYRSAGEAALQQVHAKLCKGSRLEWLPQETICHPGALADNRLSFALEPGAEMIGWDVLALGLPASGVAFDRGRIRQQIELPGLWLERAHIDGTDTRLLDSPLGWAGCRVLATLWFSRGNPIGSHLRDTLLESARTEGAEAAPACIAGCSCADERVVVLRALAHRVEPAMALLVRVRAAWRQAAWGLAPHPPRVWRT